jgi:hypothetical protein
MQVLGTLSRVRSGYLLSSSKLESRKCCGDKDGIQLSRIAELGRISCFILYGSAWKPLDALKARFLIQSMEFEFCRIARLTETQVGYTLGLFFSVDFEHESGCIRWSLEW